MDRTPRAPDKAAYVTPTLTVYGDVRQLTTTNVSNNMNDSHSSASKT